MSKLAVIAIGGNSLIKDNKRIALDDQMASVIETCRHIAGLVEKGWDVVVTHGNGPQVGFLLRRTELAASELPLVPLQYIGANTQGCIGYMIQQCLDNEFKSRGINKQAVSVVTQAVVDRGDRAFANPTKPIGSFMNKEEAEKHALDDGWTVVEDAGRGWRRVVPSPEPKAIIESKPIKDLIDRGYVVICVGGGGIPVIEDEEGRLSGVAAVIDKDYGASNLASDLHADVMIISTAVDKVAINYGKPDQLDLDRLTVAEAENYMAEGFFPPGNMGPKITAIIRFVKKTGGTGIITSPEKLESAVEGKSGTLIIPT